MNVVASLSNDVINILDEFFSTQELIEFTMTLSKFHRIQGSRDLENAARYIKEELKSLRNFNINEYIYEYNIQYGLHPPVVGWDINECYAELIKPQRKRLCSSLNSKICSIAHSPPGYVEGEVIYVGEGTRTSHYRDKNIEDKIVLAYGNPYLVYRIANQFGAKGFIFFKIGIHEDAIPYLSLFLTPEEAKSAKAPAVAISKRDAYNIISMLERGLRPYAKISVEAEYRENAKINVIEASLGDGEKELHIFAHYCHPAGTINDNVSGSATLLELVKTFDRALHRDRLSLPRTMKITFIWFPEYYGSLPYLMHKTAHHQSKIVFGVNLDMIGEKQEATKSTLNIIRPPIFISNIEYESIIVKYLIESLSIGKSFSNTIQIMSYRFDINPYDGGSDHDIYLQFSIPSIMVNQWPDIYYHTNLDTIDKFDSILAKRIAIGIGSSLYIIALNSLDKETIETLSKAYREYISGYTKLKYNIDILKKYKYMEDLKNGVIKGNAPRFKYIEDKGVITLRTILRFCPSTEELDSILETLERQPLQFLFTHYIPLLLMNRELNIDEIKMYIALEYGIDIDEKSLLKLIDYLKQFKLVMEISTT
jgi:Zn-dependent M28 family amino/carboxypeptidase